MMVVKKKKQDNSDMDLKERVWGRDEDWGREVMTANQIGVREEKQSEYFT